MTNPRQQAVNELIELGQEMEQPYICGLPLRDWLAGQALVAMGTWMPPADYGPFNWDDRKEVCALKARWAYAQADAMLAEREKGQQER